MLRDFGFLVALAIVGYTMIMVNTMDKKIDRECVQEQQQKTERVVKIEL